MRAIACFYQYWMISNTNISFVISANKEYYKKFSFPKFIPIFNVERIPRSLIENKIRLTFPVY
jgi:hypothetical protein